MFIFGGVLDLVGTDECWKFDGRNWEIQNRLRRPKYDHKTLIINGEIIHYGGGCNKLMCKNFRFWTNYFRNCEIIWKNKYILEYQVGNGKIVLWFSPTKPSYQIFLGNTPILYHFRLENSKNISSEIKIVYLKNCQKTLKNLQKISKKFVKNKRWKRYRKVRTRHRDEKSENSDFFHSAIPKINFGFQLANKKIWKKLFKNKSVHIFENLFKSCY